MDDNKTITRAHLTDIIYREIGLSHAESADLVDSVFEEIIQALENDESVKLSSFGTFSIREKKQRIGRNPKTKEEVPISARKVVTFHSSNILTKRINSENTSDSPVETQTDIEDYANESTQSGFGGDDQGGNTENNNW